MQAVENNEGFIKTGYLDLLKVALPISLGSFVQFIVVFVDNLFLSKVGINELNGAGLSGMIYVTMLMLGVGLASGAQIIMARRNGEKHFKEVGQVLINSLFLGLILAGVLFVLLKYVSPFFLDDWLRSPIIDDNVNRFLGIRSWGMFVSIIALVLMSFYMAIAKTIVLVYATVATALINVVLDYLLIFGHYGFPELGLEGAAYATVMAEVIGLSIIIAYMIFKRTDQKFDLKGALKIFNLSRTWKILYLSFPIMVQQVLALATWSVFFFLVEKLGDTELMVSNIIRNLYMLAFVSVMGLAQTTKTYVSTLIAEKRQAMLRPVINRLILLNLCGIVVLSHGLWLYPEYLAGLFTSNVDSVAKVATIIEQSKNTMFVIVPAMVIFAFSSIFLNTVEGSGRTWIAMLIELVSIMFYLGMTYYMTVMNPKPIHVVWMNDYGYFGIIGVLSFLFLQFSNWKYHKV
jgi:putative MATE family efflux protein